MVSHSHPNRCGTLSCCFAPRFDGRFVMISLGETWQMRLTRLQCRVPRRGRSMKRRPRGSSKLRIQPDGAVLSTCAWNGREARRASRRAFIEPKRKGRSHYREGYENRPRSFYCARCARDRRATLSMGNAGLGTTRSGRGLADTGHVFQHRLGGPIGPDLAAVRQPLRRSRRAP